MRIKDIKIGRLALTERMWGNWKKFNRGLRDVFKRRGVHGCTPDNDCGCSEGFHHWIPLCENPKSHNEGLESFSNHTPSSAQTLPKAVTYLCILAWHLSGLLLRTNRVSADASVKCEAYLQPAAGTPSAVSFLCQTCVRRTIIRELRRNRCRAS